MNGYTPPPLADTHPNRTDESAAFQQSPTVSWSKVPDDALTGDKNPPAAKSPDRFAPPGL